MDQTLGAAGALVAFEGVDGAGKSSALRAAAAVLRGDGIDVVETREPGGTAGAEEIRDLLVRGDGGRWSAETELLLFTAARRDHLERVIAPGVARGALVLTDRFVDSTRAYQVAGRGVSRDLVERLHSLMIGREPDLTLIFDLEPRRAAERAGRSAASEDRYERFGLEFQSRLRAAFLELARQEPTRRRVIDGDRAPEQVAADALALIKALRR